MHLNEDFIYEFRTRWGRLPDDASFFFKLKDITRFFRQQSKRHTRENKKEELDIKAKLEIASTKLHEGMYNITLQGEVSKLSKAIEEIKIGKARGATIRSKVKWKQMEDKCTMEFFKLVRQNNTKTIILEL